MQQALSDLALFLGPAFRVSGDSQCCFSDFLAELFTQTGQLKLVKLDCVFHFLFGEA